MKAYVTKYALTLGIFEVDGEVFADGRAIRWGNYFNTAHGNDWHLTLAGAQARAEEMRKAKIASINKMLSSLEKMTFKVKKWEEKNAA